MRSQIFKCVAAAILATGLFSGNASAQSANNYLVLSTVSLHFKNSDERNTFTPGIGWEYSPSSKIGWHIGTLSDSFGYQSYYAGLIYSTKPVIANRIRFLIGATVVHKQFKKNAEPETKVLPLPAIEIRLAKHAVINISGSPQVDFANQRNNAVVFFQYKLNLF